MGDPQRPLNILHFISSGRWTGAAEPAAALARQQIRNGHQVAFAGIGGTSLERMVGAFDVPFLPGFAFERRPSPGLFRQDMQRLAARIAECKPDIVHCHLPHDHWLAALTLRRRRRMAKAPAIVRTMHRYAPPRRDLLHRWLVGKGSEMVITVSDEARRGMIERVGLPAPKVAWVRGAVDLERFRPDLSRDHIRQIAGAPKDARIAGQIARMQPHRGHHWFLDTIETVVREVPEAFYLIAGRGEIKMEIKNRISAHPLSKHMRRLGYRKDDLPETYAGLDVSVLLQPGSDGTCRAMLEAMACARPVIGTALGAIRDTITPGETGWLVEPDDRNSLALALIEALAHPERTAEMGQAARRWVEEHHSYQRQYEKVMDVYQQAIERRKR